jgi:hypothetical protein
MHRPQRGFEEGEIGAGITFQQVVTGTAGQPIIAVIPEQRVVASTGLQGSTDTTHTIDKDQVHII